MKKRLLSALLSAVIAACTFTACGETRESSIDSSQAAGTITTAQTTTTAAQTTTQQPATTAQTTSFSIVQTKPEPAQPASGDLTDSIKWELTAQGALILTGSGDMPSLLPGKAPWYHQRRQITSITMTDKITSIGAGAFSGCWGITEMTIPSSVTAIGEGAFYNCENLKEIIIPDSVTSFGQCIFWRCFALEKAVVGKGVKDLPFDTFCRCKNLKDVTLSEGLERIGNTAFEYCENLHELTIPSSVTSFGYCIFPDDSSRLTLKGKAGSAAQEYAKKQSIKFETV